jgi:hypothetical protein
MNALYPSLRVFLYDGATHYSAPFTVFGPKRAALYLGQRFLVFTSTSHIRLMTRHFDDLLRAAVIQPNAFAEHVQLQAELMRVWSAFRPDRVRSGAPSSCFAASFSPSAGAHLTE